MSYAEQILPEFDQEMASTRKVLERVPDAHKQVMIFEPQLLQKNAQGDAAADQASPPRHNAFNVLGFADGHAKRMRPNP